MSSVMNLGGALSIYQRILHIIKPEQMKVPFWNYIVLVLSLIFEETFLFTAIKEFNKTRNGMKWQDAIIRSKYPASSSRNKRKDSKAG